MAALQKQLCTSPCTPSSSFQSLSLLCLALILLPCQLADCRSSSTFGSSRVFSPSGSELSKCKFSEARPLSPARLFKQYADSLAPYSGAVEFVSRNESCRLKKRSASDTKSLSKVSDSVGNNCFRNALCAQRCDYALRCTRDSRISLHLSKTKTATTEHRTKPTDREQSDDRVAFERDSLAFVFAIPRRASLAGQGPVSARLDRSVGSGAPRLRLPHRSYGSSSADSGFSYAVENASDSSALRMSLQLSFDQSRVALVTGAGRGIGRTIAKKLAGAVEHVICVSRSGCEEVVDEIRRDGGQASSYAVDVANSADVSALCDKLLADHGGRIDILVNNAGITKDSLFLRMTEKDWLDVIDTNVNSVFYFTSPLAKKMIRNHFGRIINMSSVIGIGGNAGQVNYAASKAAVIGFTRSLAKELASRNITVNAVAPGYISTQMTERMTDKAKMYALEQIPARRLGATEEVADLVAFLASDQAGYINGKVIPIDGALLFGGS